MNFFKKIFNSSDNDSGPPKKIRITVDNISQWTAYEKALKDGHIKFDKTGRLRHSHGAPVGDLILTRLKKDGTPIYKESVSDEWFDPGTPMADKFKWPE
jgi:hypothetical protein